jgi:ABC-type nickel/cobalt efflux system permease component RcnA
MMHPDPHHPAHAHNIHAPGPVENKRRDDLPGTGLAWGLVICAAGLTAFGVAAWLFSSLVTAWVMPL